MEADRDCAHLHRVALAQKLDSTAVDRGYADVDELDLRLIAEDARDVVLEADAQADERLAEQLAGLLLRECPIELLVADEALAQQDRAEVRARLVLEKLMVEACLPHRPLIGISRF